MARSSTEYDVHFAGNARDGSDFVTRYFFHRSGDDGAVRKIEMMNARVYRINFNGGRYVKACLFKAERHSTGTSKKIDTYRSPIVLKKVSCAHGVLLNKIL